ncbi:MAG: PEP-utilizing enzyme [bacterium]|nr:PEP-utilizing enzyme [bacterium]
MKKQEQHQDWVPLRSRHIPTLWPIIGYWAWSVRDYLGVGKGIVLSVWDHGDFTTIWQQHAVDAMGRTMIARCLKGIGELDHIRQTAMVSGEKVVRSARVFADRVEMASLDEFHSFFSECTALWADFTRDNMLYWLFASDVLTQEIEKQLQRFDVESRQDIMHTMSLSSVESYSLKEEQEFARLVADVRSTGIGSKSARDGIQIFSEKYIWLPYEYVGPKIWDVDAVRARIIEALEKEYSVNDEDNVLELQRACIAGHGLSTEIINLFQILRMFTIMQDDRKIYMTRFCYYFDHSILAELARRLDIPLVHARYIDPDLLKQHIARKTNLADCVRTRAEFVMTINSDAEGRVYYDGEEGREKLRALGVVLHEPERTEEVRGQVAYPGKVRGSVRIFKTSSDKVEFHEGDILITGMTTPDFVTIIKKAGAIITDEGGILCHAAIVSREMKKPCIIGTKIATKIFKDGDRVEVDAERGIVKKIS